MNGVRLHAYLRVVYRRYERRLSDGPWLIRAVRSLLIHINVRVSSGSLLRLFSFLVLPLILIIVGHLLHLIALRDIHTHARAHGSARRRNVLSIKCVFGFSMQLLSETFLILRKTERDMIRHVYWCSGTVPVILVRF